MKTTRCDIAYDVHALPGRYREDALGFGMAARDLVKRAMKFSKPGGMRQARLARNAETGGLEVVIGFDTADPDRAETTIRDAVRETDFENFREIIRAES